MNKHKVLLKIAVGLFVVLCCTVFPYQAQAQTLSNAVVVAENSINNYFAALLAGTSVPSAQSFMTTIMQSVTSTADQQTVQAYYEQNAVSTAKTQIDNYFKVIIAGNPVPNAQSFMSAVMSSVLATADQQTVNTYYEQSAVTTAEIQINNYFSAIIAGNTVPNAQTFTSAVMAAVLAQADQQAVYTYYEKTAVSTAEGQISNYFSVILKGTTVPNAQSFMSAVMSSVLATADQQTVQAYYEQNAVSTAKTQIDNYFKVIIAGNPVPNAQSFMSAVMSSVLATADQQTVQNYFNQQQVISLYQYALKVISFYSATPNSATLTTAVGAVMQLQPYNNVAALSGLGLYDDALNQLMQAVSKNLSNTNNVSSIIPPANIDGSFGTSVAVDGVGNIFVSAPSNAVNGRGIIYEFGKNSNNVWTVINQIYPMIPVPGDHFGRVFSINGNTLAASSEPANGLAKVYIFGLQSNKWIQQTSLDLTTVSNFKVVQKISLASTVNTIVVGLPQFGYYLVFNHVFDYSTTTNMLVSDQWRLMLSGSFTVGSVINSVAADGLYIVIGSQVPGSNGTVTGSVRILSGAINVVRINSKNEYTMNWTIDTSVSGPKGFGQSVAIYQDPVLALPIGNPVVSMVPIPAVNKITLAIGSPVEHNGAGAVYTMVKSIATGTNRLVWAGLNPVQLVMPSLATAAGHGLALKRATLLVSANSTVIAPSIVMAYQFNAATNQWSWAYTMSNVNSLFGSSLATNGQTAVVGSPKAVNDTNTADINQVQVIGLK
ncbi:MAG: hypothetical protein HQL12_07910 [Candidatus Omnitrophica bacterium]|nr:hypothetical protein [Candidatus Omnitrophota bacterium]